MSRVAAFTGGRAVPSARFRVRQYIPALARLGVTVREFTAPLGAYPPVRRWLRPAWGAAALASLLPGLARSRQFDVTLLQREFLSTLVTLEPLTRKPRVLDVDDAIFLYRGGHPARRLAELSAAVVCGNAYLAEWFSRWNPRTTVVPTAVDTDHYVPGVPRGGDGELVIGWIGTSGNAEYLREIAPALAAVLAEVPQSRLRIVSNAPVALPALPSGRVEFVQWSEANELADIQAMDIGIMPLEDSPWARGKCSFKMLQYMACGLPVVVSPVGMNAEVLAMGSCGLGAEGEASWIDSLIGLLRSARLRKRLGADGRRIVQSSFSIPVVAPQIARVLGAT